MLVVAWSPLDEEMTTAQSLSDLLAEATEHTIVCHNNPDPNCLASALTLQRRDRITD